MKSLKHETHEPWAAEQNGFLYDEVQCLRKDNGQLYLDKYVIMHHIPAHVYQKIYQLSLGL